uniref:tetratricopeptide repeat protein n=1 Tax=Candidatus Wunengus sp. YC61 TaxID=3367698 RepID=UPI004026E2D4
MGKDKVLDASDKETVNSYKRVKGKTHTTPFLFIILLAACCLLLAGGCAMPKIIILDDPLSPEEHITLGVVYEKKGEIDNALKEYKLASKKLPLAYLYMGNIYFQKNEFDEAESAYKKAIKKNPDHSDAYNNLAWLYYTKKENLNEAEKLALKAIELNPSKKDIYQDTLGKIRELRGQK